MQRCIQIHLQMETQGSGVKARESKNSARCESTGGENGHCSFEGNKLQRQEAVEGKTPLSTVNPKGISVC